MGFGGFFFAVTVELEPVGPVVVGDPSVVDVVETEEQRALVEDAGRQQVRVDRARHSAVHLDTFR